MDWIAGLVLGVVQGVAEWLPISSKTQVMFASMWLLGLDPGVAYSLGLFLEAASVLAALIYFRHIYATALRGFLGHPEGRRWLAYFVMTTAVTGAVGVPLYVAVRKSMPAGAAGWLMAALGVAVMLNAFLLSRAKRAAGLKDFREITLRDMALVGLAQAIAVLPGVSRSGATTTTLLLLGYKPEEAFKASFALVPIAGLGAAVLSYAAEGGAVATATAALAMAVGVAVSLATIEALLRFAKSGRAALVNAVVGLIAVAGGLAALIRPV